MTLQAFDALRSRSDQMDWLELKLICDGLPRISTTDILRVEGLIESDPEYGEEADQDGLKYDLEILEPRVERFLDDLWNEVSLRKRLLGQAYPFEVTPSGAGFLLELIDDASSRSVASAHLAYTTCLLIAARRTGYITQRVKEDELESLTTRSAKVMQFLAVRAAAHHIDGDAYWFGWPRIDKEGTYRGALRRLLSYLNHGVLKSKSPVWSSDSEKDGTVDLVAWKAFPGEFYGTTLMYGQVASGKNWRGKSVKTFLDSHFHDWFEDNPGQHYIPGMFIPFTLHSEVIPSAAQLKNPDYNFTEHAISISRRDEQSFGTIFDRLRIAKSLEVDEASACSSEAVHMQDFESLMFELESWVTQMTDYTRGR